MTKKSFILLNLSDANKEIITSFTENRKNSYPTPIQRRIQSEDDIAAVDNGSLPLLKIEI